MQKIKPIDTKVPPDKQNTKLEIRLKSDINENEIKKLFHNGASSELLNLLEFTLILVYY